MATYLNNFVAVRKTRGDLLTPAEYRSIVSMIRGIIKQQVYADLPGYAAALTNHLVDYTDPHHDSKIDFTNDIIAGVYAIYTHMTASPLSLSDFTQTIVPTPAFLELIRRILLNRFLYNQVKQKDGSVPSLVQATLTNDWHLSQTPPVKTTLMFGAPITSEIDFIEQGWKANTTPIAVIYTADGLGVSRPTYPVIFETSSAAPYFMASSDGIGYAVPLAVSSNDFVFRVMVVNAPSVATPIFTLYNSTDIVVLQANSDKTMSILVNGTVVASSIVCQNGRLEIELTRTGQLTLYALSNGIPSAQSVPITLTSLRPFVSITINAPMENPVIPVFGLRYLQILRGSYNGIIAEPTGDDIYLIDSDGAFLTDPDGALIIDTILPAGYGFVLDDSGQIVTDDNGNYVIELLDPNTLVDAD
jgi:hypothetical protein